MDHQFNFKPSRLFKAAKIVHPASIISVFFGQPVSPEYGTALVDLLDFLLNTNLPRDYVKIDLIQKQCQKVSPYLRECFPDLNTFSGQHFHEFVREFKNNEYRSLFLGLIEEKFGKQMGVIKMNSNHLRQDTTEQEQVEEIHPLDRLLNAYRPTQIYSLPKFLPPFYLHKDQEIKQDLKTENRAKL